MDTNLDDAMNLESTIGVDFDQTEDSTVINQSEITLNAGHEDSIPMEFEHIEEQPMLMDTGNEEIIVSDFMGEQFSIQEYSVQDDQMTGNVTVDTQDDAFESQQNTKTSLQLEPTISVPASGMIIEDMSKVPQLIQVKAVTAPPIPVAAKKETLLLPQVTVPKQVAIAPKQVAIAPKPLLASGPMWQPFEKATPREEKGTPLKQYTIAPKSLKPLAAKPVSVVKKVSIAGTITSSKSNSVLAQLGKQIVMVPASSAQKLKLVAGHGAVRLLGTADSEGHLVTGDPSGAQGAKSVPLKVILQGQTSSTDSLNQPAVLTKILPAVPGSGTPQSLKYVTMQQKTVPISVANNKMLLSSPTKQGVRIAKKQQVIAIKSPTASKLFPATSLAQQGTTTKKVVITANPSQNIVLKATVPPKTGTITKIVTTSAGQKTQLHQINVPGKGVQYIRLVTNPSQATKVAAKPAATAAAPKSFVLTDSKGNVIQVSGDKFAGNQPPPLVVSASTINKLTSKPQQKLVRIAPITSKPGQAAMARSGQSLLAPLSPKPTVTQEPENKTRWETEEAVPIKRQDSVRPTPVVSADMPSLSALDEPEENHTTRHEHIAEETDSKAALQELIAKTLTDEMNSHDINHDMNEVEIEYNKQQSHDESMANSGEDEHPLIVIPSYCKQELILPDSIKHEPAPLSSNVLNIEVDAYNQYQPPPSPPQYASSEPDLVSTELGIRPRKACNCTKSQCLKLYCDCFASGEFCNGCNCNNCHNNLENEELRQKAIRGCLDRNPNAFRPKIGKAKLGGPEIIRRHNKGCNCKRSGCLKNYCECYEAKIACTSICKCVGCRNVEESVDRTRRARPPAVRRSAVAQVNMPSLDKQPCSFMTQEVIEAVCQCLVAAAAEGGSGGEAIREVLEEFARCLHDIISAAHHAPDTPLRHTRPLLNQTEA